MQNYCGYNFKYCPTCQKETFFFRLEGDGCVVYLCRNYEYHKEVDASSRIASERQSSVVGTNNSPPRFRHACGGA